jgi:hypothetical protein
MKYFKLILGIGLILYAIVGMFVCMQTGGYYYQNNFAFMQLLYLCALAIGIALLIVNFKKKKA